MTKEIKFSIDLEPVSKKNSQQIFINPRTKRPFIVPSARYRKYEAAAAEFIPRVVQAINFPIEVVGKFYMRTKRKCDLTNMLESLDDVLVKAGLLADDNSTIIVSHDGSRVLYDKENPRTEVIIRVYE